MPRLLLALTLLWPLWSATPCRAQLLEAPPAERPGRLGEPMVGRFRVGAEITASRGACRNIRAMVAVPLECEEQTVKVVEEDVSSDIQALEYRDLQGGARQLLILVPSLARGATARAVVTFEVTTYPVLPPEEDALAGLKIPARIPNHLRRFVNPSPYIESRHGEFRRLAREVLADAPDDATDWERVELLYDHSQEHITYVEEPEDKPALETLRKGEADCHGRSAVFIALCRAAGVPARMVWVQGHVYSEFYLEDAEGHGEWNPAESSGSRAFGEMPLARVILQKGDNFRVPERRGERLRYATDNLVGAPAGPGGGQPRVKWISEQL